MIDFDALVLRPAMDAFARPITVEPLASAPGQPAYSLQADGVSPLRGDYREPHAEIDLETGTMTTTDPAVWIRLSEFPVPPAQNDRVLVGTRRFLVLDAQPHGEGRAKLILREIS